MSTPFLESQWPKAALFMAVLIPLCATAKEPSLDSLEKLFAVSQVQAQTVIQIKTISAAVDAIVNEAVKKQKLTPVELAELRRRLPDFSKDLQKTVKEELAWNKVKGAYIKIYRKTFSQEEVDGLIAFYQGPVGNAFVNKLPQANEEAIQSSLDRLPAITQRIEKASAQFLQKIQPTPPPK